jgi:hypothetical protein
MNKKNNSTLMDRRGFLRLLAATAFTAQTLSYGGNIRGEALASAEILDRRHEEHSMTYRKLGRTNFMSSRLVFGCAAALAGGKAVRLLERAFEAGINHFDEAADLDNRGSERNLAPFLKKHRESVWIASKAPVLSYLMPEDTITKEEAKTAAQEWLKLLETSLKDLRIDYIDAYYIKKVNNHRLVLIEELYSAFLKAKAAGKVGYFGLSTHSNAQEVLQAAIKAGWYDVAMIAITPAGWYDFGNKEVVKGTATLVQLAPLLQKARDAGMGIIGMKAARHLSRKSLLGSANTTAFDKHYDNKFLASALNAFQRSYIYVLEHGIDVVNSDMQNFTHLEENIVAASTSHTYFT